MFVHSPAHAGYISPDEPMFLVVTAITILITMLVACVPLLMNDGRTRRIASTVTVSLGLLASSFVGVSAYSKVYGEEAAVRACMKPLLQDRARPLSVPQAMARCHPASAEHDASRKPHGSGRA